MHSIHVMPRIQKPVYSSACCPAASRPCHRPPGPAGQSRNAASTEYLSGTGRGRITRALRISWGAQLVYVMLLFTQPGQDFVHLTSPSALPSRLHRHDGHHTRIRRPATRTTGRPPRRDAGLFFDTIHGGQTRTPVGNIVAANAAGHEFRGNP